MPHFECGAFDHSATSPGAMGGCFAPRSGRVLGEEGPPDKARAQRIMRETPAPSWAWLPSLSLPPAASTLRRRLGDYINRKPIPRLKRTRLRPKRIRAALAVIAGLMAGSLIGPGAAHSETIKQRPCDIYAAGHTPCVAAHSTVRSLYAKYTGPLYQVKRASDDATENIGLLPDGYTNAAMQDAFCSK